MAEILLNILENERRYVARELHDGVAQTTLQLGLQAGICRKLLERGNLEMLTQELAKLEKHIQLASTQVRDVIGDMRPPQIEPDANLNEYMQTIIDTHTQRGGPPVTYQFHLTNRLPRLSYQQKLALTRIVQEALLNVHKHAQAEKVYLTLSEDANHFHIVIADDGQGFDPAKVEAQSTNKNGAGLANLRARAQAIGGSLSIARDTTRHRTEIKLILPKD